MNAKLLTLSVAAGAATSAVALPAQAAPSFGSGIAQTDEANPLLDQVQNRVFVYHGRPYCFYFDGWHGAGWYRCGWNWRHGLGWGGVYGWNDWEYGPAIRRFGYHHRGGAWRNHGYSDRGGNWSGKSYSNRGGNWTSRKSGVQMQGPTGGGKATTGVSGGAPRGGGKFMAPSAAASSKASAPAGGGSFGGGGKGGDGGGASGGATGGKQ